MSNIFKSVFDRDPRDFDTIEDLEAFVEEKNGAKLQVQKHNSRLISSRGCIFKIRKVDAEKEAKRVSELVF